METFIDIATTEREDYCQNCEYYMKWGCHTGVCLAMKRTPDRQDWDTCKKFKRESEETQYKECDSSPSISKVDLDYISRTHKFYQH